MQSSQVGLFRLLPNYPFLYLMYNPVYSQSIAVFRYQKKKISNTEHKIREVELGRVLMVISRRLKHIEKNGRITGYTGENPSE